MNCRVFATCFILLYIDHSCNGGTVQSSMNPPSSVNSNSPQNLRFLGAISKKSADSENGDDYYEDYYHELEEPECEEGFYWHIRGLKCVPVDCPRGNQFRDRHTGDCLLRQYGFNNDNRDRQLRLLSSRMKSQKNKFKLPFGLTLKG